MDQVAFQVIYHLHVLTQAQPSGNGHGRPSHLLISAHFQSPAGASWSPLDVQYGADAVTLSPDAIKLFLGCCVKDAVMDLADIGRPPPGPSSIRQYPRFIAEVVALKEKVRAAPPPQQTNNRLVESIGSRLWRVRAVFVSLSGGDLSVVGRHRHRVFALKTEQYRLLLHTPGTARKPAISRPSPW